MKKFVTVVFLLFSFSISNAQTGGSSVYRFLEVPASARIAALGGTFITVMDNDPNAALQAPSLLNSAHNRSISFNTLGFPEGTRFGDATFIKDISKYGTYMASMHYVSYGNMQQADEFGNITGTFKAAEYAFTIAGGYRLNQLFSVGAGLKALYSDYYLYNSFGLGLDLSATYVDTNNNWTATILFRNIGAQLNNYVDGNNEPLPAEALIGVSKRLKHTPLRFNLTYRHLEKFDLSYIDPNELTDINPATGIAEIKQYSFGDKLMRHFILGTEVLLSKNFHLRAAYNFQRRRELAVSSRPATVGISFGAGIKISKFIISYGRAIYSLAGASNSFSISTNLSEFTGKGTK